MIRSALFCVLCSVVMCVMQFSVVLNCCEGFLEFAICCGSKCEKSMESVLGFRIRVIYMFFEGAHSLEGKSKDCMCLVEFVVLRCY